MGYAQVRTSRVVLPDDAPFLEAVYRSTREAELSALGWPSITAEMFARSQFDMQTRYYASAFPSAEHLVVVVDGTPAGRLIVDRSGPGWHVVDLSLLVEHRGAGVGTAVVRQLLDEAAQSGVDVTCHAESSSRAQRFWEHLGFIAGDREGVHVRMAHRCGSSPGTDDLPARGSGLSPQAQSADLASHSTQWY
jgi:GNAT superfamily N-acetyltransferase